MSDAMDRVAGARESLRIACLIDDLGTGGAQRIVTVMARHCQVRADVELVIISLGDRDDEGPALAALGVRVHQLPAPRVLSISRAGKLLKHLRAFEPDVIHTHLLSAHILGGLCGSLLRVPVISTLHNVDPHPRFAGTWKRRIESSCLRYLTRRCLAVGPTVASSNAKRLGNQRIDILANPLSVVSDSAVESDVDPIRHRAEARARLARRIDFGADTRLFLTVGRLSAEKGWPELLDVFERLRTRYPDCRLISVGDGPLQVSLEQEIAKRDLTDHITLCGRRDDVSEFYAACDVFMLNSTIEGLPMALLEAMAAGLPVVATRVGDVEFALGDTAVALVDAGDTDAMVDALSNCHEQWDKSLRRGQAGPARVTSLFNVDSWMQQLLTSYHDVRLPLSGNESGKGLDDASLHELSAQSPSTLHVVEMVDGLSSGGAQSLLKLRARNAASMGYRIDVIALRETDRESRMRLDGVTDVHDFPSPHMFDLVRIKGICSLLRQLKPDVIHTHLRTSNTVGALCGRLTGIPVVSTLHNIYPEPAQAHARRDWAEKWALRLLSKRITAVGPTVRETHHPRFAHKPIEVIPNPVELPADGLDPEARRQNLRLAGALPLDRPDALVVLSAARLTESKGLCNALRVVERVKQSVPELHYFIAGEGEQRACLEAHIRTHDMGAYVTLLGRSDRVRDLMAASDLFLLTSSGEGMPLVLLEAMSMQLPIVATRVGDIPWLLQDGALGALVEPGDINATVRAVEIQLTSQNEAREGAARAFEAVKTQYSVPTWLRDMDQTYRQAIGTPVQPTRFPQQQALEWNGSETDAFEKSGKHRSQIDA